MLRRALILALFLMSCARPNSLEPSKPPPLDPVDDYILHHMFIGDPDRFSPVGGGNSIRTENERWVISPVWSPPNPGNPADANAYYVHALCFVDAFRTLLIPGTPGYDRDFEEFFRRANVRANALIEPMVRLGELRDVVHRILLEERILHRLVEAVDPSCTRTQAIPEETIAGNEQWEEGRGIQGRRSFSGPQEPCAIFRYCMPPGGASLMYDFASPAKQECFALHEKLLEDDDEYRRLYSSEMTPYLEEVAGVPPEEAVRFLIHLYEEMQDLEFFKRLQAAYESQAGVP